MTQKELTRILNDYQGRRTDLEILISRYRTFLLPMTARSLWITNMTLNRESVYVEVGIYELWGNTTMHNPSMTHLVIPIDVVTGGETGFGKWANEIYDERKKVEDAAKAKIKANESRSAERTIRQLARKHNLNITIQPAASH